MSCNKERGEVKLRLVMVMRAIFLHKHRSMVAHRWFGGETLKLARASCFIIKTAERFMALAFSETD
jgi:hypothetical protein